MPVHREDDLQIFGQDIREHGGYRYSTHAALSSRLAHKRISDAILEAVDFRGKRVIDIGCGDGEFTIELFNRGGPDYINGIDVINEAVQLARQKVGSLSIAFNVASAYDLPYETQSFDIAHVRAVLHHMRSPELAVQEALRVASTIVIAEPNGNNPGVKLFERLSRYHLEHKEKSYSSSRINRWVRSAGGVFTHRKWIGLVPTFCPDWAAKAAKTLEPVVEKIPGLNAAGCSIYIVAARQCGL